MVAYDSRRTPDPEQMLRPTTANALRIAFRNQHEAGTEPIPELGDAIRAAAREARERDLQPEAVLIQLKTLANEAVPTFFSNDAQKEVRQWMVLMCIRAYWE